MANIKVWQFLKENVNVFYKLSDVNVMNLWRSDYKINNNVQKLCKNLHVDLDARFFFGRDTSSWGSYDEGLVIDEHGIYLLRDNDYPNDIEIYLWSDIEFVDYNEEDDCFEFEYKEEDGIYAVDFPSYYVSKPEGVSKQTFKDVAQILNKCAQMVESSKKIWLDFYHDKNYEAAIQECEKLINAGNKNVQVQITLILSKYLRIKEKYKSAELVSDASRESFNEVRHLIMRLENIYENIKYDDIKILLLLWKARMYYFCREFEFSRRCYISVMEYAKKDNDLEVLNECKESMLDAESNLKEFWDERTSKVEYKDRKFLMPIADKDIAGCVVDGIDVFRMSNIPSCIKFPVGHPVSAQLYIGHPFKNELYVPYETSEEVFFVDKVHELCYLLQCLGAVEISITSIKGKGVDELYNSSSRVGVNASYKVVSGDVSVNNQRSGNDSMTNNSHRTMYLRFDPMNKPYLPKDGLVWYGEQPEWQRLVNNRLNGNMLEYSEKLSTVQTRFVSSSEKDNVKVNAKILWLKAGVDVDKNMNKEFKENIDTTWQIDVKFRSIRELQGEVSNNSSITSDEQEYLEEVKACLEEEGSISERERRLLDKFRAKLGISKDRAEELEKMCNAPALTEDEKEYLDEYKLRMEDGVIDEKDRKRLDRLKNILDISDERANEIEKMA